MRRALLLPCLLAAPLPAQEPADPLALIATAEKRIAAKPDEDAVLLLWQAAALLQDRADSPGRTAAQDTIRTLLQKADPLDAARSETHGMVARKIVELAQAYRLKKWLAVAEDRLHVAARFDAAATTRELQLLQAARAGDKPAKPADKKAEKPAPKGLLEAPQLDSSDGEWRLADGMLQSPPQVAASANAFFWLMRMQHADQEVACEFKPGTGNNMAGLILGASSGFAEGYLLSCDQYAKEQQMVVTVQHLVAGKYVSVQTKSMPLGKLADGFHRLVVGVRGEVLDVQLDDARVMTCSCPTAVHGRLGFLVSAVGGDVPPITFRNLTVGPLPEKQPTGIEERAQLQAQQRQGVLDAVGSAELLLKQKQPEPAVLLLRQVLRDLRQLDAGTLRDNLTASIDKMLAQADTLHARRKKLASEIAVMFAALADRYQQAGLARSALAQADEAAAFDPDGQAARLQQAEQAVQQWQAAQLQAQLQAHLHELDPPADDGALLRQWFAAGQRLDPRSHAWIVDGPAARASDISDNDFTVLMPQKGVAGAEKVSVQVRLPAVGTSGGLAFDVAGQQDYAVGLLMRKEEGLELQLHRYTAGEWHKLVRKLLDVPEWRLEGWFELQLEVGLSGVVLRSQGSELIVERRHLNRGGALGLCAGNLAKAAASVELRAFRLLP